MANPKELFRSLLLGALIVYACLIPWGLFGAWFWNNWTWGDPEHVVQAKTLTFWMRVTSDTLFIAGVTFFRYWLVTFPFIAWYARWVYRRRRTHRV